MPAATPSPMRRSAGPLWMRVRLFASSYAPLFLIMALRSDSMWVSLWWTAAALLGVTSVASIFLEISRIEPEPYVTDKVSDRGSEVAGYLATYILPFVTVGHPSTRDLISYFVFLLVLGAVYVRSSLLAVNAVFYMLGYRVTTITSGSYDAALVHRHAVAKGDTILAYQLAPGLLLASTRRMIGGDASETQR